jgi:hypothetical protein
MTRLHFDDLTKITCPPGMLDDDTFNRLRAYDGPLQWWVGNQWLRTSVRRSPDYLRQSGIVLRAEPAPLRPLIVPWHVLDDWIQWVARNENGEVWGYKSEPCASYLVGWQRGHRAIRLDDLIKGIDPGTVDWRDSLIRRPEGV